VKYACEAAKKIIAISSQTKEDLIKFFKVDPEKIEVVFQSVSPVFFDSKETEDLFQKYELRKDYILSVGTIEPRKNPMLVLKAVKKQKLDVEIVFVGKPTDYSFEILKYISDNKMDDQVKILSNIPRKDLAGLYRNARLSVYMSVYEGFGLPVIESMASGCPVITSNVSCLPETAGGAAILCSPSDEKELGNHIKNILTSENSRNDLIQKGNERAKIFHPQNFAQKMISLYSELLS
jgi:glycosyltransferase involved in cell wall biosynthesis